MKEKQSERPATVGSRPSKTDRRWCKNMPDFDFLSVPCRMQLQWLGSHMAAKLETEVPSSGTRCGLVNVHSSVTSGNCEHTN